MLNLLKKYFENTKDYSTPRFIIELALLPFPLKVMLGLVLSLLPTEEARTTTDLLMELMDLGGYPLVAFTACVIAPMIETIIGQSVPISILSQFTRSNVVIVLGSTFLFAAFHRGVGVNALAVIPPGIFLAWSYLAKIEDSFLEAFWITSAIHSIHNGIALALYFLLVKGN